MVGLDFFLHNFQSLDKEAPPARGDTRLLITTAGAGLQQACKGLLAQVRINMNVTNVTFQPCSLRKNQHLRTNLFEQLLLDKTRPRAIRCSSRQRLLKP